MNETLSIIIIFIEGVALGTLFFGGLWLTVKRTVALKNPALLILGSFILRLAAVLTGFFFISSGNWRALLTALIGFIVARYIIIHLTSPKKITVKKEANYGT